jgi:hypothetical protein
MSGSSGIGNSLHVVCDFPQPAGLRPADSIHLASAAQAGTDLFPTNDKNLVGKIVPGIQFIAPLDTQLLVIAV